MLATIRDPVTDVDNRQVEESVLIAVYNSFASHSLRYSYRVTIDDDHDNGVEFNR